MLGPKVPYVITLVDLEEGVRQVSGIPEGMRFDLQVGMPLECKVIRFDEAFALLEATITEVFPDAVPAPYVMMAATDSLEPRKLSVPTC